MSWDKSQVAIPLAGLWLALLVGCGSVEETGGLVGYGGMQVLVNEIVPSNNASYPGDEDDFPDWIELYNAGTRQANLKGYFITDNANRPAKQMLPAEAVIPPKGFLILLAAGIVDPEKPLYLSFLLSGMGEGVWLSDPNGNLLDGTEYGHPPASDYAYARFPDGTGAFQWCGTATPGERNDKGTGCLPPRSEQ
jgi:hypothetical protein